MNKKRIALLLIIALVSSSLLGCSLIDKVKDLVKPLEEVIENNEENDDKPTVKKDKSANSSQGYSEVLDRYYGLIFTLGEHYDYENGETGVFEAIQGKDSQEALESIGYARIDFSGDGIPELIIGGIAKSEQSAGYGSEIYALYNSRDEERESRLSFEGWNRSQYHYMKNGNFFYHGSEGAMNNIWGVYSINNDGSELICQEYYFTQESEDNPGELEYYYNSSGEINASESKKLNVSDKEFMQKMKKLEDQIYHFELTPFAQYKDEEIKENVKEDFTTPAVIILPIEEGLEGAANYDIFDADEYEEQAQVVLMAKREVKDFKVLALEFVSANDDGEIVFDKKEIYTSKNLSPKRPLLLRMTFFGTIPSYGISYVDGDGETKTFGISESGKDGSLQLIDIQ